MGMAWRALVTTVLPQLPAAHARLGFWEHVHQPQVLGCCPGLPTRDTLIGLGRRLCTLPMGTALLLQSAQCWAVHIFSLSGKVYAVLMLGHTQSWCRPHALAGLSSLTRATSRMGTPRITWHPLCMVTTK